MSQQVTRRGALGALAILPAVAIPTAIGAAEIVDDIPAVGPVMAAVMSIDEQLKQMPPETAERLRTVIEQLLDETWAMIQRGESSDAIVAHGEAFVARANRPHEIKRCMDRTLALLREETGEAWGMFLWPENTKQTPLGCNTLAKHIGFGLDDRTGILGERLGHGIVIDAKA